MIDVDCPVEILKVDRKLGIAFGFGLVCEIVKDDAVVDYYDLHGDNVSPEEMMKAATEFAMAERLGKLEHGRDPKVGHEKVADVVFMFPLTQDVAKGLGITTEKFGLLIGYKPLNAQLLDDIEKGVFAGFSFGGTGVRQEVAA